MNKNEANKAAPAHVRVSAADLAQWARASSPTSSRARARELTPSTGPTDAP